MSAYVEYALSLQSFVHMASVEQSAQQAMYSAGNVPAVAPMAQNGSPMMAGGAKARPRVSTTLWEDESTLCFQVEARGISVARREDNDMINGTKLLNVAGMTRGRRDGMLKAEKDRRVVKIGAMHLKGVWIPFDRALSFAQKEGIAEILFPLFVEDIRSYLYRQTNPTGAEIPLILPGEQKYQQSPARKSAASASSQQPQVSPGTQPQQPQQPPQQYNRQYPQGYAPTYGMQGQYSQPMQSVPAAQVQAGLQGNLQGGMHANYPGYQYSNYPQMMYQNQQQHQQHQQQQAQAQGQGQPQGQAQGQPQSQNQTPTQAQSQPQGQPQQQVQGQDYAQQMYYPQQGYQPNGYEYPAYYKKD